MLYFFWCYVFTLPLMYSGKNVPVPAQEIKPDLPIHADSNDKTRLTLPSEGGTVIVASTPDISLQKEKLLANLLELEQSVKPKEAPVHARKGVDDAKEKHAIVKNASDLLNNTVNLKTSITKNEFISKVIPNQVDSKNNTSAIPKPITSTEVPKKPQILSYEALVNADKNDHGDLKILTSNPSSKTLQNMPKNQIQSPNEDAVIKFYPSRATSHPGMIMPIVITILVVPMFAIVGYMALKRGQEAWKNRHYKRMDFLLDGMYND